MRRVRICLPVFSKCFKYSLQEKAKNTHISAQPTHTGDVKCIAAHVTFMKQESAVAVAAEETAQTVIRVWEGCHSTELKPDICSATWH